MKIDKYLKEVWEWKDEVYRETKDMGFKERLAYDRKHLEELEKKYHIHLRVGVVSR